MSTPTPQTDQVVENVPSRTEPKTEHKRHGSKHRPRQSVQIQSPGSAPQEARRLSPTELIYPDPITAQEAFEQERANNPLHRRAPTPHVSRRRSGSLSSNRSGRSGRSPHPRRADDADSDDMAPDMARAIASASDAATVGPYEPHFGSARGIGPAGEAIEVIGLGRKEPRHRKYAPHLLKPALRTGPSRERVRRDQREPWDKPLPGRPSSYIVPLNEPSGPGFAHVTQPRFGGHTRSGSSASIPTLRSLFSSLSVEREPRDPRPALGRRGSRRDLLLPGDDLFTYLRIVDLPQWTAWPNDRDASRRSSSLGPFGSMGSLGFLANKGTKGFDRMPWAWHRRMEAAEAGRQAGRALIAWESAGRSWEKKILDCELALLSRRFGIGKS